MGWRPDPYWDKIAQLMNAAPAVAALRALVCVLTVVMGCYPAREHVIKMSSLSCCSTPRCVPPRLLKQQVAGTIDNSYLVDFRTPC